MMVMLVISDAIDARELSVVMIKEAHISPLLSAANLLPLDSIKVNHLDLGDVSPDRRKK